MIIGTMFFFLMRALGEILLSNLHYKSFIDMAHDLIGPGAGYYIGWSYWLGWVLLVLRTWQPLLTILAFGSRQTWPLLPWGRL
jgi:D-serine/D-alanine/glycine transporter